MILYPIHQVIPKFEPETSRGSRSYETDTFSLPIPVQPNSTQLFHHQVLGWFVKQQL